MKLDQPPDNMKLDQPIKSQFTSIRKDKSGSNIRESNFSVSSKGFTCAKDAFAGDLQNHHSAPPYNQQRDDYQASTNTTQVFKYTACRLLCKLQASAPTQLV
jgi:hypothetical protein